MKRSKFQLHQQGERNQYKPRQTRHTEQSRNDQIKEQALLPMR